MSPRTTTLQSSLKLRGCSHIEAEKIRVVLVKSNLSCKVLSPRRVFSQAFRSRHMVTVVFLGQPTVISMKLVTKKHEELLYRI